LKTLNNETSVKYAPIKKNENTYLKKELSSPESYEEYRVKLKNKSNLGFYNLKNDSFKNLMEGRQKLIEKCKEYEEGPETKDTFADVEALNWVV
jgi:hypothetical protein